MSETWKVLPKLGSCIWRKSWRDLLQNCWFILWKDAAFHSRSVNLWHFLFVFSVPVLCISWAFESSFMFHELLFKLLEDETAVTNNSGRHDVLETHFRYLSQFFCALITVKKTIRKTNFIQYVCRIVVYLFHWSKESRKQKTCSMFNNICLCVSVFCSTYDRGNAVGNSAGMQQLYPFRCSRLIDSSCINRDTVHIVPFPWRQNMGLNEW